MLKKHVGSLGVIIILLTYPIKITLAKPLVEEDTSPESQVAIINQKNFNFFIRFEGLKELAERNIIQINRQWYIPKKKQEFQEIISNFILPSHNQDEYIDAYVVDLHSPRPTVCVERIGWNGEDKMYYPISTKNFLLLRVEQ